MKIIVPIKQVPETSNVKMDPETGTMIRTGVEPIVNPLDLYAIEEAVRLKNQYGGEIVAVTMGPPSAHKALREAISMGCDEGILLSDKKFAGADTWSTSYVLSKAIEKIGNFDIILCGERATDGDTGQVGPGIAAWLNIPFSTYVSQISEVTETKVTVKRIVENGYQLLDVERPTLITVVKEINFPRLPTLDGKIKAKQAEIPVWGPEEITAESEHLGLKGSPTRVVKISTPKVSRDGERFSPKTDGEMEEVVDCIIRFFEEKEII
ncbi:MAG: electron transfer flavoprotein subunit beta/FixA family protein [Candidatus Marinimicrobia bacterium]|nr:electron transfer flavoprotein subunit beta/FixA family protein [Candidatus Neomarinimicrobiota bacterium]